MKRLLVLVALLSWWPSVIVAQVGTATAYETVLVPGGALTLKGLLWKPVGSGPFPAVLFSHGGGLNDIERAEVLGPVFARHGYAFLYLFRRGYGPSADQGEYMRDILDREAQARGEDARKRLYMKLFTTDHLDDVLAGLTFLKRVRGVDPGRLALVGHSFGGSLTLLAAERDKSIRALVCFGPAAQNWDRSPEYRNRLLAAIRNNRTPLFLTHAANDFSIVPGQTLAAEAARLKRTHELKIYPPVGTTPAAGHAALYTDVPTWEGDVFRFLDRHVQRLGSGRRTISGQAEAPKSTLMPCRAQPSLVGKCFRVRGRLSLYNGAPTIRLWRVGTRRILGVSASYSQAGYSSIPDELERRLDWETEMWGDFLVCPFTRLRPKEMQMICIEDGKNVVVRKRR